MQNLLWFLIGIVCVIHCTQIENCFWYRYSNGFVGNPDVNMDDSQSFDNGIVVDWKDKVKVSQCVDGYKVRIWKKGEYFRQKQEVLLIISKNLIVLLTESVVDAYVAQYNF